HAVTFAGATALMLSIADGREGGGGDVLAEEFARSEARAEELEAILDTATDGVIVIDGRGKIGSMNRAAEALFGVDGGDYRGRYFTDLLADESQKPALDYLDGLASNGVASVLNDGREVIGRVPQGGLILLFMTMGRIDGTDKFCAVLRDITHWKAVEGEMVAARRAAEAANQQKSDFLAKISHEIRTPLNAIIGFSEVMMEERFGPIGNTRYREYMRDIHVSGAHLMSLINDLLDLSKIEAGKVELTFEAVPPNAVIQESVAIMQPQANRERIIIRTSLMAELPNVVADPRSFRQILLNLLSNAIKFTRAGGQVIVSTSLEDSGEVVVRIRDTGIGMTEKDIETALKPFRQVALARDDRDHGTGLGLPLTKALVEANRATFGIESAPNQGTLVKITFPTTRVLAG
ncbi:MAG: ATP-binding protein, partial [Bauldia sp.]